MTKKIFFILLLLVVLPACSNLEFATNWADTYIDHQIDNYFDLDHSQDTFVSAALKENIQKIRKQIYPLVSEELRQDAADLQKNPTVTVEMIDAGQKRLQVLLNKILAMAEPSAMEFVDRLHPEQLKNFEKEFAKKNDKIKKEVDDKDTAIDEQTDKMETNLKYWLGNLSRDQRKQLREFCKETPYPQKERLSNRQKIGKDFVAAYPDVEKRHAFIHTLMTDYKSLHEKAYLQALEQYQKKLYPFLAKFLNDLKPDEKKTLIENFNKRADELKKISEKKP